MSNIDELHAKVDAIASDVHRISTILIGNGRPQDGMVVRLDRVERRMDTLQCASHDERITRIEKSINKALLIYGGIAVGLGLLANIQQVLAFMRKVIQ